MNNNTTQLMDKILDLDNIDLAVKKVKSNKGSAGVDKMTIKEMEEFVKTDKFRQLLEDVRENRYTPKPVKIVEIPKPDGGMRMLGIPTVLDRVIQQAINQILTEIYDCHFSEYSYGFRPNRGAHDALVQAEKYVANGSIYIVDIDLSKFFDTINRDKLMHLLKKDIEDIRVLRIINKYLYAGMLKGDQHITTKEGTPQGSPLSPLLSNIYLNELDKELTKRNIKFCRYADDIQIYATSIRGAYRIMENTIKLIECKRFSLKVNREKSKVHKYYEAKFLGYSFRLIKGEIKLYVHNKSVKRFKDKVRKMMKRNRGISIEQYISELNSVTRGWVNYYMLGLSPSKANKLDGWIRDKIRVILWKQWKTTKMRKRMQRKYTIRKYSGLANSSRGMYNVASHQLHFSLRNKIIREVYQYQELIMSLEQIWEKKNSQSKYTQTMLF